MYKIITVISLLSFLLLCVSHANASIEWINSRVSIEFRCPGGRIACGLERLSTRKQAKNEANQEAYLNCTLQGGKAIEPAITTGSNCQKNTRAGGRFCLATAKIKCEFDQNECRTKICNSESLYTSTKYCKYINNQLVVGPVENKYIALCP